MTRVTDSVKSVSPGADLRFDGAPRRQRPQRRRLRAHGSVSAAIAAGDEPVDEAAPVGDIGDVARAAQDQRLVEGGLEVAVVGVHRAVLMRLTGVVAAGGHAVVRAEAFVAPGDVLCGLAVEVAICGREAVGAMLGETPPDVQWAFWRVSASAVKLSPPSTTPACCQPPWAGTK